MDRTRTLRTLAVIILILSSAALIIRAFFGFCSSDEPFYLSTTKRLFEGDLIFVHDWFPTQLSSLILLPFYAGFVTFTGGTEGVILFFRILYALVTLGIAAASYFIVSKRYSLFTAFSCAFFMLFYVHLNIATLSYYAMCFEFYVFSMLLLTLEKKPFYILSGFVFSLAVLSLPSLAVPFSLAFAVLFFVSFKQKDVRQGLIFTMTGIIAALILFLIYLFASGNSISGLIEYLPYVLSDDEHITSLVAPFKKFFTSISDVYGKVFYLSFVLAFFGLLTNRFKKLLPFVFVSDCILFFYYLILSLGHTGFINTAFALFAGPLFFMCVKKDWFSFVSLFLGGLFVSMTYSYSSNGELYVLSIGHGIACVGAILFTDGFIKENGKLTGYTVRAFIITVLIQTAVLRFINVYRDAPLRELNVRISEGPAAGLYTTASHEEIYSSVLEDIRRSDKKDGYVLFSKLLPWGYLACDMRVSAPSTWRNMINSERLEEFYRLFPDRKPDVIFVLDADVGSYDTCGDVEADAAPNKNEWGGYLADYIGSGRFKKEQGKHLTVYH